MMTTEISPLYEFYREVAIRIFTNMQFLASAVEEDIQDAMQTNPQLFGDRSKQVIMQKELDVAKHMVNLYQTISKNNPHNIVQAVILYKPESMTRIQFANYVASAAAIPLVKADTYDLTKWYDEGMPKGFYETANTDFFLKVEKFCLENNIAQHIIETKDGQMKAMGVGPSKLEYINRIVGNLKKL
jgi:peptidyl-tRNA hydrolase